MTGPVNTPDRSMWPMASATSAPPTSPSMTASRWSVPEKTRAAATVRMMVISASPTSTGAAKLSLPGFPVMVTP